MSASQALRRHHVEEQQLSRSAALRAERAAQLEAQREPKRPPTWIRDYASTYPLPDGVSLARAWRLRYSSGERDPDLELWWMLAWMAHYLRVPSGLLQGRPWTVYPWQRDFLSQAYRPSCGEATLSTGRKNGKSGLMCSLIAYHLSRHGIRQGWRGLAVSIGGPQAVQLFEDAAELMQVSGMLEELDEDTGKPRLRAMRTTPGRFRVDSMAAEMRMMTSNVGASGVGASADLCLLDELGAYPLGAKSLVRNVETSTSARGGRTISISVEGVANGFMDARHRRWQADPDRFHYRRYAAGKDRALDDPAGWAEGNPGLGQIKSVDYMKAESFKALMDPSISNSFRNLELNQRVSELNDQLVSVDDWTRIEVPTADRLPPRDGPLVVGVDLGGVRAFSGCCAAWPRTGRVEGLLAVGGVPDLTARGRADGVDDRYLQFQREGSLHVIADAELVDHDDFLRLIEDRFGVPDMILSDEYRRAEFLAAMRARGNYWPTMLRRLYGAAGNEDTRAFQRMVVQRRVTVLRTLAWTSALAETKVVTAVMSRSISIKGRRETARIDLVAAAVLCFGAVARWHVEEAQREADSGPATETMPW